MINCTPQVMSFTIYLQKNFIQVPSLVAWLHTPCPTFFEVTCQPRAKPVPPVENKFTAYVHASFMQKVFHVSQWERKPHIKHNCKLDNLRTGFEVAEWNSISHSWGAYSRIDFRQSGLFWLSPIELSQIKFTRESGVYLGSRPKKRKKWNLICSTS